MNGLADLVFVAVGITYGVTLWLYRGALDRHGMAPPVSLDLTQEARVWVRALTARQELTVLERYCLLGLLLMVLTIATAIWAVFG